jgi:hypothetical protein
MNFWFAADIFAFYEYLQYIQNSSAPFATILGKSEENSEANFSGCIDFYWAPAPF